MTASFDLYGPTEPVSPVVLSVPHAGRDYPPRVLAALRVPVAALLALEDRYVDLLAIAARGPETMLVQRTARTAIDLNRREDERDPAIDEGAAPIRAGGTSLRLRGGLGLIPRRVAGAGEIWRRRLGADEVEERIAVHYRPYHAALDVVLNAARARFGVAVLLDIHSMPPLIAAGPQGAASIVIGDRFGQTAGARFVDRAAAAAGSAGMRVAINTPYAGAHLIDRHAAPARDVHALQIEFARTLYLDRTPCLDHTLAAPGPGMAATARLLRAVIAALTDEAARSSGSTAAEPLSAVAAE